MESDASPLETSCAPEDGFGNYDVFISHRSPDTKTVFAGFLFDALTRAGLHPFLDCESIGKSQDCWTCISHAIKTTPLALVVFSASFSQSEWCLRELHLMLESPSIKVLPIFYNVEPWELRFLEKGQLGNGFAKLVERHDELVVENWRSDLRGASNLNGWEHKVGDKRLEKDFVKEVVRKVFELANKPLPLDVGDHIVGLQPVAEKLIGSLQEKKVVLLGLWGMGGIGKWTLARELYNRLGIKFDARCYVEDVAEKVKQGGVTIVQNHVLKAVCENESIPSIVDKSRGKVILEERLRRRSILLVLDDIRDDEEMYYLVSRKMLGDGSMCIVTSRNRRVFENPPSFSVDHEVHTHEVQGLSEEDSRSAFAYHAFGGEWKMKPKFEGLAGGIIMACGGVPLVLKVFGSLLRGEEDKEIWEEVLKKLHCGSIMDEKKIFACLRMSYDALVKQHQEMFLDIACALLGLCVKMASAVWRSQGWSAALGVRSLVEKALIRVVEDGSFGMHDHLRDMGRAIAREEGAIVGICQRLNMPSSLALLKNDEPTLLHSIVLENVLWLDCGLSSVPFPQSLPSQGLVVLSWRDDDLQSLPESFGELKALEYFELIQCGNLKTLPSSFWGLQNLKYLNLDGSGIQSLPESFDKLSNFEDLFLRNCCELANLPDSFGGLQKLKLLRLGMSEIHTLPESFGRLSNLEELELSTCDNLVNLPDSFGGFQNLKLFDLSDSGIQTFSESFGRLSNLEELDLRNCCEFDKLPNSFGGLQKLKVLDLRYSKVQTLPKLFGRLSNLEDLKLSRCGNLVMLPDSF